MSGVASRWLRGVFARTVSVAAAIGLGVRSREPHEPGVRGTRFRVACGITWPARSTVVASAAWV